MTVKVGAIIAQSTQKLMEFRGQDAEDGKLNMGALLTAQIDAIALLSHTNYELWLRGREAIILTRNTARFVLLKHRSQPCYLVTSFSRSLLRDSSSKPH